MNPTVTGALIALGGASLPAGWAVVQYFLARSDRRQEVLRAERQACYARFVSLADDLLMALEEDWQSLRPLYQAQKSIAELKSWSSEAGSARESIEEPEGAAVQKLEHAIAQLETERLRPQANAVRAARIQVEMIGSNAAASEALTLSQNLYELLGSMSDANDAGRVEMLIGKLRGGRLSFLGAAKGDVQLLG